MKEQRFNCTACGKCCYGWLPLTLEEAIAGADLFPLALSLTPVKQGDRAFKLTTQLGSTLSLGAQKKIAVLATPIAYIPPALACPALSSENLCTLQANKPLRCRTMPFYPFRDEAHQAAFLVPRKDWRCDITEAAPVVYRDGHILDRRDFDAERKALVAQADELRRYTGLLFQHNPVVAQKMRGAAQGPVPQRMVVNFASFMRMQRKQDLPAYVEKQYSVLALWIEKTETVPELAEYTTYYREVLRSCS